MIRRIMITVIALATALFITGCHRPQGAFMPSTGDSNTYFSYETRPVTITILDLRTGEEIFSMNVPPGKQLTFDFVEDEGDDPVYTPDIMRYQVFDMGTETGKLRNTLSVPPANARRIDVTYREDYEYRTARGVDRIRKDQLLNRPQWWNPESGMPLPERLTGVTNYDR